MGKEVKDSYARRILQKYRLHPDGWLLRQDRVTQDLNAFVVPTIGSVEGTLITLDDSTLTAVEDVPAGTDLLAIDGSDPIRVGVDTFAKSSKTIEFETSGGKFLNVTPAQVIMMGDGGAIEAEKLVLGFDVFTVDGIESIVGRTYHDAQAVYNIVLEDRPMWYLASGVWIWSRDTVVTGVASFPALEITTMTVPAGVIGRAYSETLSGTGGDTIYTWSAISSLPTGVSFSSGGSFSGTPTVPGTYTVTVRLTDSRGAFVNKSFSLAINPALSIAEDTPLASGAAGEAYEVDLTGVGGITPYTFSVHTGTLPTGLSLASNGVISGTASTPGSSTFTIRVVDDDAVAYDESFTIVINAALNITTTSPLTQGVRLSSYSNSIIATGGVSPRAFSIFSGSFPSGLTMNSAGVVSGTPSTAGTSSFTVRVQDTLGYHFDKSFSLTIGAVLSITTASPLSGVQGSSYSSSLAGTGGQSAYTWAVVSGSLPGGISLSSGGAFTGTPTTPETASFTVRMTDVNGYAVDKAFDFVIASEMEITTSSPLADGLIDDDYGSYDLTATGGTPPYTWSVTAGALPESAYPGAGDVCGTPVEYGDFSFTAHVADSSISSVSKAFDIHVAPTSPHILNGGTLDPGQLAVSYSFGVAAGGGVLPRTFSILSGSLPDGLSMDSDGLISGTPTTPGNFPFTVRVTDDISQTDDSDCFISVAASSLSILDSSPLPDGAFFVYYDYQFLGDGGITPYYWFSFGGSIPSGLSLSGDGHLSGYPTESGDFTFTVYLHDNVATEVAKEFTLHLDFFG